jgi:hypothetical protein
MPFKVVCPNCQKALAAKEEMAGRTVRCPKCKKPLTVPAPKAAASQRPPARREAAPPQRQTAAASSSAGSTTSIWDDDLGAAASPAGTGPSSPCPGCGKSLGEDKVVCIDCGYNRKLGRKMVTQSSRAVREARAARSRPHSAAADAAVRKPAKRRRRASREGSAEMIGGLGVMILAAAWLYLGYVYLHRIYLYPPIMFIGGLLSFLKGLFHID